MSPTLDMDRHLQPVPDPLTASPAHDGLRPKRALAQAAGKPESTFTHGPNLTVPGDGPLARSMTKAPTAPHPFSGLSPRGSAQRSHTPRASQWPRLPGRGPTHSAGSPGPDMTRPQLLPTTLLLILCLLHGRSCTKHTLLTSLSPREHDPEGQGAPLLSPLRACGGTSHR